jgi:hypothetical protein
MCTIFFLHISLYRRNKPNQCSVHKTGTNRSFYSTLNMIVRWLRPQVHLYSTAVQHILYSGTALKSCSAESPSPCPLFPHPSSLPWTNEQYRHRTLYVGIVFNRFYRLEIHSPIVVFVDPACELVPHERRNYTCVLLPLSSTFSLTYTVQKLSS